VLIVANRSAGAGKRRGIIEVLSTELIRRGFEPQQVTSLGELSQDAERLLGCGELRAVVAAGGDGTAAAVVNNTPPGTPIAICPMGTENLLAKYLEIGKNPAALATAIAEGRTAWLDAGRANGRLFLLMASAGFDAEVVRVLHDARKGNITHWSYTKPILQAIRRYKYPELRMYCAPQGGPGTGDDATDEQPTWSDPIRCRWSFVFNLPCYGRGLQFAPAADGTDGLFDACTFERGGLLAGLKYLAAVVRRGHHTMRGFKGWRSPRFRIEADEPVPYELDGDPGGFLPLEIDVVPRRLRVLVPTNWSQAAT
jgi:diacylglycerol kinase family enzyme